VKPIAGGFMVHSHAGDGWRVCRDHVAGKLGLPAWEPGDERHRRVPLEHVSAFDRAEVDQGEARRAYTEEETKRISLARNIWNEGRDPRGTPAQEYLTRGRKLDLPDDLAGKVLRFHPRCPWRDANTGQTIFIPALLAAFSSFDTGDVTAIHRIRVDQPHRWPKANRMMLGPLLRAAVMLDPVGDTLSIGEGVETCMAAREMGLAPCWALGSAGRIARFPLTPEVCALRILGEAGKASAKAIEYCVPRWNAAGRHVRTVMPDDGLSDLNDELMRKKQLVPA
jgi:hypothetical protein